MALNLGDILIRMGLDTGQFSREMRAAQRQLQGAASGFRQAGQTATMAFTVPLVAAGAAALKFASDFDSAMTQSMAIMSEFSGASELTASGQAQLRGEMEKVARTVSKELNLAANDAAKSYFFLTSAGMDAQQSIAALPQVARFAKAGMFDFATATDLATDAQSALGLKSDDVQENLAGLTRVTDVLVRANQLANASVEQFSQSLTTKAGAALKIANKSIEEGVSVLAAFADQGVKAQDAGTALNIVLRELSTKAIKNRDAFKTMGVAVFDENRNFNNMADIIGDLEDALEGMSDAQKKATLLQLGFTDKSVIFLQTLIGTSEAMRQYQESLESAGGAAKEVAEAQLKAFNEQMGMAWRRIVDAAIAIGSKLMPIVLDFVVAMEPLIQWVESAAKWFAAWPKPLQLAAVAVAGLVAAVGPLLIVIGFIGQGIASLIAIWPALAAGFGAFGVSAGVVTTALTFLGSALAALGVGIAAFKITDWILEWTGLRETIDSAYASVLDWLGIYQQAVPASTQETKILVEATALAGRKITDWNEAIGIVMGSLDEQRGLMAENTEGIKQSFDAMDRFATAMGVSRDTLEQVASRLGMTTQELLENKKATELVKGELKKMANEAKAAENRLRSMVKTVRDAEKDARDLAKAVEIEGGAMALTTGETMRLAAMIKVWREENIEVAASLDAVVERAEALERAARLAAMAISVLELENTKLEAVYKQMDAAMEDMLEGYESQLEILPQTQKELDDLSNILGFDVRTSSEAAEEAMQSFGQVMLEVAAIFEVFGISAQSGIGQAIAGIATLLNAMPALLDSTKTIQGMEGSLSSKIAAGASTIAGGVASIGAFTSEGSTGSRTAKGALAGFSVGSKFGPYGAAIGAGVGALVGFFRGRAARNAEKEIRRGIGNAVSKGLNEAIRDASKDLNLDVMTTSLLFLSEAFTEAGGVAEFGMLKARNAVMNLVDATVSGRIPMATGLQEVGEAFQLMAAETVAAGDVMSSEMFEIVESAKRLGEDVPGIVAFMAEQLNQAVAGVGAMVGGIQIVTQEDALAQAEIFATTFFAAVEEMGILAATEAMGPAFDALKAKFEELGIALGPEGPLAGISRFFDIARDPQFGPLLEGLQGLTGTLAGLANTGYLTAESFNAIQHQGLSAFDQLLAAGLTEQEALQQMAPLLQAMIDASNQYGHALDPATAALIEQAEAAGIAFKADPMYVMADAMILVAELLGATSEQIEKLGETATGAAEGFDDIAASAAAAAAAAGAIDVPGGNGNGGNGNGGNGGHGNGEPPHYQHGGLVTSPHLAVVGEVPEVIIPVSDLSQTTHDPPSLEDIAGAAGGGPQVSVNMAGAIVGDPHQTAQAIGEAVGIALREGYGGATDAAEEGRQRRL
ncbi:MAG: phage tail tape measure protein [bacterium]|nr:phage tail tape measure protein [bacterium]